jgi:hypothetical protein
LSVLLVPRRAVAAAEESALLFALLEGGASDGVQEGADQADAGKEVEDGEELAGGGLGGEVAVSDGGQGDGAEIEGVEQALTFDLPVEERARGEGHDDQDEEPAELPSRPSSCRGPRRLRQLRAWASAP